MKHTHTHTPGPWTVDCGQVETLNGTPIAQSFRDHDDYNGHDFIPPTERDLNMRLISAAPEMLEALEMLLNSMLSAQENQRLSVSELVKVRELILKARGES